MDIKPATFDDLDLILKMTFNFLNQTSYAAHVDAEKLGNLVASFLVNDPYKIILLCENKGMIAGVINPFIFGNELMATEVGWWVEPNERKNKVGQELLEAFERWAKSMDCKMITMVSLDDKLGMFYEKIGYRLYERAYLKEI